jgi:hypothetical protein
VNKFLPILLCLAVGLTSASVSAQELYPASGDSRVERARGDADDARRREADVAARINEQERANATIRDQLRRLASDPAGLQKDLVDVSEQAAALRKKVTEQRRRRDAAEDRLNEARGRALEQYEQTGPMKAARNSAEDAAAELDRLSQPILEQLGQDPGYQDAQALVDASAQAGEALQGFDNVDPRAQAEADAAFDQAMSRVREIEDAAIDADPKGAEAHKSLKIAQDMLEGLRMENEKKIATNPAVDAARFALDLEQKLLDDGSADLSTAEKRLSALRQTTQPNAGPPTQLSNQLKDGEGRLRDLNDQLDQARIARQDADDRLRFIEGAVAGGRPAGETYTPSPSDYPPPSYEPSYGGYYDSGGYGYSYAAPVYGYRPYYRSYAYDPFYCPPYYGAFVGTGFFFGASYYSRPYYHSYYRPYYYSSNYHHFHDDSWRRRYDYWRGGGDGRSHDGRVASGNRRYDYARFDRNETTRDRSSRSSIDRARLATSDSERDYRYRTGVNTYNYPGSTAWRQRERDSASLRASQYESAARERRAVAEGDARRAGISIEPSRPSPSSGSSKSRVDGERDRTSAELRSERASSDDARRREASDSNSRARTEWRPRTSADETRGTRPNEDYGRSRSSSDSGAAAADRPRASDAPRRDSTPSRGRSIDAPPPSSASPSRGSSRGGGGDSPPPSSSSGRGSSRGGGGDSAPPSSSSGRGSFRSDSAPSSGGSSRGSARGGGGDSSPPPSAPSRGSSSSGGSSSSRGGGSSGSSSGSGRGR